MANKFVWSGATGANDGSSWDNAYTTLAKDWGAEAGFTPGTDFVYVRSVHSETVGTTLTITGSTAEGTTAPVRVICVVGDTTGTAPGNLATGAALNTNAADADIIIDEGIYIYGVDFFANDDLFVGNSGTDHNITLEQCRLELTGVATTDILRLGSGNSAEGHKVRLVGCTFDFAAAAQGFELAYGDIQIVGGSVAFDIDVLFERPAPSRGGFVTVVGLDVSSLASSSLINGAGVVAARDRRIIFSRCLLGTGSSIVTGTIDVPGFRVESYHCQIGTDSDPAYQMEIQDSRGKIEMDTARYRTGGASDGVRTNPYSWSMDTTVGSVRGYPGHALESPPITGWTDGDASTAHTYRIYIASGGTLNDDDIWFELEGPNDAATDSMAVINTTRVAPRTTAAAYTTDGSSTWTGADVGTKQQMDITYTPDKPGPITARIYMAVASDRVSIDPKIAIDP